MADDDGEVVVCDSCGGSGEKACSGCAGTGFKLGGRERCPSCKGSKIQRCGVCGGSGNKRKPKPRSRL